jgi:hypothetical protein
MAGGRRVGLAIGRAAVALGVGVLMAGCAGDDHTGAAVQQTGTLGNTAQTRLAAAKERCAEIAERGAHGRVVWPSHSQMTRGNTTPVAAAVTLARHRPGDVVLRGASPGMVKRVWVVSCLFQARLSYSDYEFDVEPAGWQARSTFTSNTAHWTWFVKPKLGGDHTLVIELRPVLELKSRSGHQFDTSLAASDIAEYPVSADVSVPWQERPAELMSEVANDLKVAEGLVKAATGLVVAIGALLAALGIRRLLRRRAAPQASD